ncbi:MAG: hypothetical protein A2046_07435 [Bacteroidetes bacterium GWA2_30_7]|nr:MAG: hypothetical protein A2046_07435 [Bacteroidetes bacterium GWA2_30_7]
MNKKLIIPILTILLIVVIVFMVKDLFFNDKNQENPYELNTDSIGRYDSSLICYNEIFQINLNMEEPKGIAIDDSDFVYVAGIKKIMIFDSGGKHISEITTSDTATCIAVNSKQEIFAGMVNHIEVWNKNGTLISKWKTENPLSIFTGIAVNDSLVFVADATERLVHQFTMQGKLINNIGAEDSLNGIPGIIIRSAYFDVALGRDNEIWVGNQGRYSVEAYDFKGNIKSSWGVAAMSIEGFSGCCNPTNFAIFKDGSFVTSEKAIERVKIYSQSGEFKCVVAGTEKFDKGTKGLDLAIDSKERIFVLDPMRKMVRVFEKKDERVI